MYFIDNLALITRISRRGQQRAISGNAGYVYAKTARELSVRPFRKTEIF